MQVRHDIQDLCLRILSGPLSILTEFPGDRCFHGHKSRDKICTIKHQDGGLLRL